MLLYVGIGGALGSILRFLMMKLTTQWVGVGFPYGTLVVNILGSLAMGLIIGWGAHKGQLTQELRTFIAVGVLGGFTTFSTFSLDVVTLFERGGQMQTVLYVCASVTLSVLALMLGMASMR
jgi:fluoride exporter